MVQAGDGAGSWIREHWKILMGVLVGIVALALIIGLAVGLSKGSVPCEDGNEPVIDEVINPGDEFNLCLFREGVQNVTLKGDHFYRHRLSEDDSWDDPVVKVDGKEVPSTPIECSEVSVHNRYVEVCTQMNLALSPETFPAELVDAKIEVTNPEPCGNTGLKEGAITLNQDGEVPLIETVVLPPGFGDLCVVRDGALNVTLQGDYFYRHKLNNVWVDPVVKVNAIEVTPSKVYAGSCVARNVNVENCKQLTVELTQSQFSGEIVNASIEVVNPAPCNATGTKASAITMNKDPECSNCQPTFVVLFADPPATYNQVQLSVTIFSSSKILRRVKAISQAGGTGTEFDLTGEACVGAGGACNKISATVPVNQAPGAYRLQLEKLLTEPCTAVGAEFAIKGTTELALATVSPTNIKLGVATAVTISRDTVASNTSFGNPPRIYIDSSGSATALQAVTFVDGDTLTAVIPETQAIGTYNLIVVNPGPGFEVASKVGAFVVQAASPPEIDFASPYGVLVPANGKQVTLRGRNLAADATVVLRCIVPAISVNTTVAFVSANEVEVTIVETGPVALGESDHCLIDYVSSTGSFTFSSIYFLGTSANLAAFTAGPELVHARYRHAVRSVRPTAASKHLVAIGGTSDGTTGLRTVESATISERGVLSSWRVQRNRLPAGLYGHRAERVSQYVYLMGGTGGGVELDSVHRAHVLDPLATPTITDIGVELDSTATSPFMPAGLWYYRIAATFPDTHSPNPGGETLPSDAAVLDLPAYNGLSVVLTWEPVAGATGYRVYRSPTSGADIDSLEFLDSLTGLNYTDSNGKATTADLCTTVEPGPSCPLRIGDVGVWHTVPETLLSARTALLSAVVPPPAGGTDYLLFAMGGRTEDAANISALVDYASITVTPKSASDATTSETQAFTVSWTAGTPLASPLSDSTAYAFSKADSLPAGSTYSVAANEFFIYTGIGRTTGNAQAKKSVPMVNPVAITGGSVASANAATWEDMVLGSTSTNVGICMSAYTGRLFFSGSIAGGQLQTVKSVVNWNAGLSDVVTRVLFDCYKESGFTFNVGGVVSGTTVALNSTSSTLA